MSNITTRSYVQDNSRLVLVDIDTVESVDALVNYWRTECGVIITDEVIGPEGTVVIRLAVDGIPFVLTSDDMGITEVHTDIDGKFDQLREFVKNTVEQKAA
ncbi:hypothetical protein LLG46_02330 [bacterium]|nr:hypothetical protein [bacterium]